MINFSTAGRDSNAEERKAYFKWDKEKSERLRLASVINKKFPNLEACLGGEISLDIQPRGFNKSLASKWVRENEEGRIFFIGDKTEKGGNDFAIAQDIKINGDGEFYKTLSPVNTKLILDKLDF
tara:strand:- start:212 stop:583 length:372 start_codon:yes stop_codon:yes gene_type:complete